MRFVCVCSSFSRIQLYMQHGLWPAGFLCPWHSPGKNAGVGCHFLLQEIFLTQGSNLNLLHCRQILYRLSHQGSPLKVFSSVQSLSHVQLFASLPVHHQLPEFTQTHIHRVSGAIQPSHLLLSPSPAPNLSQHQSLFQ